MNVSLRLTAEQKKEFEKSSKAMGIKISSYIVNEAWNSNKLDPKTKFKIQYILNFTENIVKEYAPEQLPELKSKGAELWSL